MVACTCHPAGRRLRQEDQGLVKNLKPARPKETEVRSSFVCLSLRFSVFRHPSIYPMVHWSQLSLQFQNNWSQVSSLVGHPTLVCALVRWPPCHPFQLPSLVPCAFRHAGGAHLPWFCSSFLGVPQAFPPAPSLLTLGIFILWVHLVHAIFRLDLSATDLSRTYHAPESMPEIHRRVHIRPGWKTVCVRYMWKAYTEVVQRLLESLVLFFMVKTEPLAGFFRAILPDTHGC